jgi:hypothetical protein
MAIIDPANLNRAIVLFLGYGISSYPDNQSARLTSEFGPELAFQLEQKVSQILDDLDLLKPDWSTQSFDSACIWAKEEMHRKYPELDSSALSSLEWAFSWGWK